MMTETMDKAGPTAAPISTTSWQPWGLWTSLAIVLAAEVSQSGLDLINPLKGSLRTTTQWAWPLLVIVLAVWLARAPLREYLAWVRLRATPVVLGVLAVLAVWSFWWGMASLAGQNPWAFVEDYRAAIAKGTSSWWYVLSWWPAILYAPFVEETLYRGFLWRGVEASLGGVGALLVTSLCFATVHYNYYLVDGSFNPIVFVSYVFSGLIFGWVRGRSSTIAAMIVHSFDNIWVLGLNAIVFAAFAP
jgi:membrane protease YdiL (CAAX protease family)